MPSPIRLLVSGPSPERGLLDTSVVIALGAVEVARLPEDMTISALTLAELARGPATAPDAPSRARRQELVQLVEAVFEAHPFDAPCARAFGRVCAEVSAVGRKPRGTRTIDLMIASTALAHELPLYTLNASDLRGLDGLIEIVDLG
jgi:predicted nucleic acid-binding protein